VAVSWWLTSIAYGPSARAQSHDESVALARAGGWSFFGGFTSHELSNPGLHLGVEHPLASTTHFQSLVAASFHAHHEPDTETGYALHTRWGQRYTASFGLTFDSYLGIGAQYTQYDTTVFEFRDSVATAREQSDGRVAFSPHLVFGPGFDLARVSNIPVHVYARPGVTLLYPDLNLAFQASVIVELGLRWTPP
jgi:hypothetical protein